MTAVAVDEFIEYLQHCGGSEILEFDTDAAAGEAAWKLRNRHPTGISISASYNKVYIKLIKEAP